ncbi:MAG TPA: CpsD/CapB family tyrosine-protein kinase [Vitreimonas sp.]|uniref:CpsD/CapB family tyrosine-protein kinase n=1 Tax=Vitreimonas sp. TaxID=3069702 RepID=UPI002D390707|nr:CpsD/CapB family tyrosine-protein kinase [Vitreimonas sp.]HYD88954.1 CpsD/CapB family tyrosine-protein kinase [Vitreimonas sp.]
MTSPLTSDRTRHEAGSLGASQAAGGPPRQSQSLAWARLGRAIGRQWLLTLAVAVLVAAAGVAFDYSGGVRAIVATQFWAPVALAVGLAVGAVNELRRNTITSISSFGKHRGYAVLGAAPELTENALRQLPPDKRTPIGCLAFLPASPFATAFRDLQGALENQRIVSFVGALADDGATTTALCAAVSAAQQGRSVIIIDCDLRRRGLTRALEYDVEAGVLEASAEPDRWRSFIAEEEETGLHFLPAARLRNPWKTLAGSRGFPALIDALSEAYDLVVLDCPPALGAAEGVVLAGMAEKAVVVAVWDRTQLGAVRNAMRSLRRRPHLETGVWVNRVPPRYRFGRLRPD